MCVCVSEESLCGSRDLICQNLVFVVLDVVTRGFSFSSGREYSGLVKDSGKERSGEWRSSSSSSRQHKSPREERTPYNALQIRSDNRRKMKRE